jgi:hypothetical protein
MIDRMVPFAEKARPALEAIRARGGRPVPGQ